MHESHIIMLLIADIKDKKDLSGIDDSIIKSNLRDYFEKKLKHIEGPKIRWSIIGFLGMLLLIVIGTGVLVFYGKLDSGSFTFLLGTLIGGSITFLGDLLLPPQ